MTEICRFWAKASDIPSPLGVTEAGLPGYGTIKSAIGIGSLLCDGIGDTIRGLLTRDKTLGMHARFDIFIGAGGRSKKPRIVGGPSCGRGNVPHAAVGQGLHER